MSQAFLKQDKLLCMYELHWLWDIRVLVCMHQAVKWTPSPLKSAAYNLALNR
jgi:hypothetical protein